MVTDTFRPTDAYLRTLLLCLMAGGLLTALGLPLGWMIGSLVATAYLTLRHAAAVPALARPAGLLVLGLSLGQGFTAPVLEAVVATLPVMLAGGILVLFVGAAVAPLYRRIAGTDLGTAVFACIPGGVVAMAMLAARAGVAVPAVTIAQSIRMALVVLAYPTLMGLLAPPDGPSVFAAALPPLHWGGLAMLLAGGVAAALAGWRIGLANAAMFAPCLLAMVLSAASALPSGVPGWLVDAAQVAMGASLGTHLAREGLGRAPQKLVLAGLASGAAVSLLLAIAGFGLGWATGLPVTSVVLGLAPGGLPEMVVTAQALGLAVPLVLGLHLMRMVLVNLLAVPAWRAVRWWVARR